MSASPVSLDFSQAQPRDPAAPATPTSKANNSVSLDFSKAQPLDSHATPDIAAANGTAPQPGIFDRAIGAVKDWGTGVFSAVAPPQDHKEELAATFGGPQALVAYRAAKTLVDGVENTIKAPAKNYQQAKTDFQRGLQDFANKDWRNAASDVASTAADVAGGASPATSMVTDRARQFSEGAREGGDLVTPTVKTGLDVAGALALDRFGGGEADAATGEAATEGPGTVKRTFSPAAATQPGAQSTLRAGAAASAEDAGVGEIAIDPKASIRALMDKPIAEAAKVEDKLYETVNDAAGTDMKSLYDRREELQDAIEDPTNVAQKSAIQKELTSTEQAISEGEANVQTNLGKDASDLIDQAKAATQQRYSMEEGAKKIFNNESVVSGNTAHGAPETINVNSAIKAAENLDKPSKFATTGTPTRLQQMFGEDGANAFKQGLYDAKAAGQKVASRNQIIKWTGITGVPVVGTAYELLKH